MCVDSGLRGSEYVELCEYVQVVCGDSVCFRKCVCMIVEEFVWGENSILVREFVCKFCVGESVGVWAHGCGNMWVYMGCGCGNVCV